MKITLIEKMDNKDIYCVIMAGGIGSRFWRTGIEFKCQRIVAIGVALVCFDATSRFGWRI